MLVECSYCMEEVGGWVGGRVRLMEEEQAVGMDLGGGGWVGGTYRRAAQVSHQPKRRPQPTHITLPRQPQRDLNHPPRKTEFVPGVDHPPPELLLEHLVFLGERIEAFPLFER